MTVESGRESTHRIIEALEEKGETETELMRLLASNVQTKTLSSGAMEELLKHVDALVQIGWQDGSARDAYFANFANLTNPPVRKVMGQPIVRETVVQAVEMGAYFRTTKICDPAWLTAIMGEAWADVSDRELKRRRKLTKE